MPLPALQLLEQKLEKQKRLFELRRGALERTIEQHIQLFEQRKGALEKKIEHQFETHRKKFEQKFDTQKKKIETRIRRFEQKNGIRLDDEVRFIRSWIEKPLTTGAVTPSGRALARTMASYIDPRRPAPGRSPRRCSRKESIRRDSCWSISIRFSAACCARAIRLRPWCRATPMGLSGY